jgi:hypothetical protein
MKKAILGLALAGLVVTAAVFASSPSPLPSGTFPGYTLQTWQLANGTIGAQIGADGSLSYVRGLQYVWPSAHAAGVLTDNGSGTLTWSVAASAQATHATNADLATLATQATHATNADLATWASHIAGAAVSNAVAQATHATNADLATLATQATHATNADLATWATYVAGAGVSNAVAEATHATNADTALAVSGLTLITNTVVSGVVTNGDGSITVTTTNVVYVGLRP